MKVEIEKTDADDSYGNLEPVICGLSRASISDIVKIESLSDRPCWSENLFADEFLNDYAHFFGARVRGKLVGFLLLHFINDESHILKFGILPEYRSRGVGRHLISYVLRDLYSNACRWVTLEVRKSNLVAKKLYESLGFTEVGIREGYYTDNNEDAQILSLSLAHFIDLHGEQSLQPRASSLEKPSEFELF